MPPLNGSRRHRKHSTTSTSCSSKKKVHPPDLNLTNRYSSSSNNSTSDAQATPTSRSIFSSSFRSSRRNKDASGSGKHTPVTREEALRSHPPAFQPPYSERAERRASTGVDVFEYMEAHGGGGWGSPAVLSAARRGSPSESDDEPAISPPATDGDLLEQPMPSPRYSDLEVEAPTNSSGRMYGRSATISSVDADGILHSDSGVSVHSGSPDDEEGDSPILKQKYLIHPQSGTSLRNSPNGLIEPSILEDDEPQSAILQQDSPDFPTANTSRPIMHRHVASLETSEGWVPEACPVSPSPPHLPPQSRPNWADGAQVDDFSIHSPINYVIAPQPRRRSIYAQSHLEVPPQDLDAHAQQAYISPCPLPTSSSSFPQPGQQPRQHIHEKTGYALLASKIAAHGPTSSSSHSKADGGPVLGGADTDTILRPIYRKFETLQNRMLLYLQDEISELDTQLQDLDAAIAAESLSSQQQQQQHHHTSLPSISSSRGPSISSMNPPNADPTSPHHPPESRRHEAKLPTQLQWHRMDLLSRLSAKLNQYNSALTGYAKLTRTLSPARGEDVEVYREWVRRWRPVVGEEVEFVGGGVVGEGRNDGEAAEAVEAGGKVDVGDLVTVLPPPPSTTHHNTHATSASPSSIAVSPLTSPLSAAIATASANEDPSQTRQSTILASAFLATVVMFNVVPTVLARMVLGCMVGLAAMVLLVEEPFRWERWVVGGGRAGGKGERGTAGEGGDGKGGAGGGLGRRIKEVGLWVGVMGVLAVVVR